MQPRLDHVVVNVLSELDDAAERYRRLGFTLTPRGHHTLGTSNNLAIFGTDYLELLGWEAGKAGVRPELVDTPPGLAGLVFKPEAGLSAALAEAGIAADPSRRFSRPVELDGGSRDASFETTNTTGLLRSGRVFFCRHETPELVWRPEWQAHPNGVTAIAAFVVACADPAAASAPFGRLFGPLRPIAGGVALDAGSAAVEFISGAERDRRFGDAAPALEGALEGADRMVALMLRTRSLPAARAALAAGGIAAAGDLVPAREACGVALGFVEG